MESHSVRVVSYRAVILTLLAIIVGFFLATASSLLESTWPFFTALLRELGAFIVVAGTATLLWELFLKRQFTSEIFAVAQLSQEIQATGVRRIGVIQNYQKEIDWSNYFNSARQIDLSFAYARTWRNDHMRELAQAAADVNVSLRLFLPDPGSPAIAQELATRFQMDQAEVVSSIKEAEDAFKDIFCDTTKGQLEVFHVQTPLIYSFYRFDQKSVISLFKYQSGKSRGNILTIESSAGGTIHEFLQSEIGALQQRSRSSWKSR